MINEQELWEKVKELIASSVESETFKETFSGIDQIYKVKDNFIYLVVPNQVAKYRINKFYLEKMNDYISQFTSENLKFKIIEAAEATVEKEKQVVSALPKTEHVIKTRSLRAEYTFDNFVTGEANREAFTFAVKIAESPNVTINPFYIFGDVGLGKTHLMMAIGHYIYDKNINVNIVYTTAQQFVEDYFKSKNKNQRNTALADEFDDYYRSADVFLVDDIQYLADRQGSQDEFFKLFEYLFENNKQIIITSDRPASELNIMARLKSRFSWGIQSDIRKPNQLLREAILKAKLKFLISDPSVIPADVITYIANNFDQNVRELEGALRRFISYCVSFNIDFNLENAAIALEAIISKDKVTNNEFNANYVEKAKEVIASYFNINVKDLSSPSRRQDFVYARSIATYLLKTKFNLSLNKIGAVLGGRDHATIAHAYEKIANSMESDSNIKEDINNLTSKLDKLYQ